MSLPKPEPLCRYRYDPLDRLAGCLPLGQADTYSFYRLNKLTTEIQGQIRTSWLQADDRLLAQYQQDAGKNERLLIATDVPGSVIHALGTDQPQAFGYTPYGTRAPTQAPLYLPGFNGERRDPVTGHYLLGNGYRAFNPVLMRFNSPDSLSPFGEGGLNAYGYCAGDPVNRVDPSGHVPGFLKSMWRWIRPLKKPIPATNIKEVAGGIWAFERLAPNKKTIGFLLHGTTTPPDGFQPMHLAMSRGDALTAQALKNRAIKAGIEFEQYDNSELLGCFLGTGGEKSYAKKFSALTGIPSDSYQGLVSTNLSPQDIENLIAEQSRNIRKLPNGSYEYAKGIFAYRSNPSSIFSRNKNFNYHPVTFKNYYTQKNPL